MKKCYFMLRAMAAVVLMAVSTMAMTSCEKETNNPSTPNDSTDVPDLYQEISCQAMVTFDGNSYSGNKATILDFNPVASTMGLWMTVYLDNKKNFNLEFADFEGDSVSLQTEELDGNFTNSEEGRGYVYSMTNCSATIIKLGNSQYHIYGTMNVATPNGLKLVEFDIKGGIYDHHYPTGSGTISYGKFSRDLSVSTVQYNGTYIYDLRGYAPDTYLIVESLNELSSDMPISNNREDMLAGTHVYISAMHQQLDKSQFSDVLKNGTLQVSRISNNYTISLECNSLHGKVVANYEGIIAKL